MKAKNVQSIICLVFFSLFANQAWAADWIYFDTTAVGDMYYDKSSIKKVDKSIISVWNKDILSEEAKTKYFSILKGIHKAPDNPSMLSYYTKLMEIDCVNKKIKDISVIFYDEKGNVIYSSPKSESGKWNAIIPNTVGEKLINIVSCEPVTPNETVVAPKTEKPVTSKEVVVAHKALTKLKKSSEIDFSQIKKRAGKKGKIVKRKMEFGTQKKELAQKPENKTVPSIETQHYYEGIKGIVLTNGEVIEGQIISVYDDVLKIRSKDGKIFSYSFMKVEEYITE
jgi:hypothetical protein